MTRSTAQNPVFTAIDVNDLEQAKKLVADLKGISGGIKLGKEFFTSFGPQGILDVVGKDVPLFLDLKFHDIPNTVAGAVRSACKTMSPSMMTIHASGGPAMVKAASDAAKETGGNSLILAVTVLTSMDQEDLVATGVEKSPGRQVVDLAKMAKENGADGVICSPLEIDAIRKACGPDFKIVVPGIRPADADHGDQKRVKTPVEAMNEGADYLVIGRPITSHATPATAAADIVESLS